MRTGGAGKDIYKWDFNTNTPQLVGQMSVQKNFGFAVKISSRWFARQNGNLIKAVRAETTEAKKRDFS